MANHYRYPDSIGNDVKQGQHYILFSSYESTSAVAASTKLKTSIALYIPPNSLTTTINQNYQDLEGGASRAVLGGAGRTEGFAVIEAAKNLFSEGGMKTIAGVLESQTSKVKQLADFRAAGTGLAQNNHVALTYRGPAGFREHTFAFQFFPKHKDEADEVRKIIKDFQNGSTPRRVSTFGGGNKLLAPYFASPRQWTIKFIAGKSGTTGRGGSGGGGTAAGEKPYLPKIKRSVITSFGVNHDPDSVISFHKDGSPVHSTLTLTFKEIDHVISEDAVEAKFAEGAVENLKRINQAVETHEANSKGSQKEE